MDDDSSERIKKVILSTMKCRLCQNFLSVVSKDGGRLRCTRCRGVPGKSRISAFMKIAQEFSFPCVHEGCAALVPWKEVRKHEEMCNERSVKCPFNNLECGCVKMKELVEHLQNKHQCKGFFDTVTHNLDPTINRVISVLTFKNHIFFVLTTGDPQYEIFIIMLNNSENTGMSFTYNVQLSNESNDSIVLFKNQQISSLREGNYCLACWLKKCSVHSDPPFIIFRGCHFSSSKALFGIESFSGIKYSIEIVALENIAQDELSLPCNHEGCEALVPWDEVQKHEKMCGERSVRCPFKNLECTFIKMKELVNHLQNIHKCNVFFDILTQELDAKITEMISVVVFKNHIFLVLTRRVEPDFQILIIMLNNSGNTGMSFTYNLRLSNNSNDEIVLYKKQKIDLVEKAIKYCCFGCWLKKCSNHHRNEVIENGIIKKINLFDMTLLGLYKLGLNIKYSIEIVAVENRLENKEVTNEISSIQTNNLRNMLQCPICMEYMIGHIFNCENGHVLCHTCKTQVSICPTCQVTLGILRCIPLENQAEFLLFDCSFADKGCNFSGKVKILCQHEKECSYKAED